MRTFQKRSRRYKYRCTFAHQLAAASGDATAFIGFFDIANRIFVDSWIGRSGPPSDVPEACMAARLVEILDGQCAAEELVPVATTPPDPEAGNAILWLDAEGCLIGVGGRVGDLVAVAALLSDGAGPADARDRQGLMQMAIAYAMQELSESHSGKVLSEDQIAEQVLQRLSLNFAVVDGQGEIRYITEPSRIWLEQAEGLEVVKNRLSATSQHTHHALQRAIRAATSSALQVSVVQIDTAAEMPHVLVALPVSVQPPQALVVFGRDRDNLLLRDLLLETYGLTKAERRLALQLLSGKTLSEAAKSVNLTTSTARSYLKRIFAKTGSHRQSELISLCHTLVPPLNCARPAESRPE